MTHRDAEVAGTGPLGGLGRWLPEDSKDYAYSLVSAVVTFLLAFGLVDNEEAALWTQLAIALVTCTFALIYSPSAARSSIYAITGPVGAVLMGYGLVSDVRWAIIVAGVGQVLGVTTAAVASGRPNPKAQLVGAATLTGGTPAPTQRA